MQKSYVAKHTINFVNFEFYIRPGDLLVHDPANQNRLTVYRNGQIVKVVKQNPLGVVAMLKSKFIEEVTTPSPTPVAAPIPVEAPKAVLAVSDAPESPTKAEIAIKRRKAHGEEVLIADNPRLVAKKETEENDETHAPTL
jgi:hypothetical protein